MRNPWFELWVDTARLALEAQAVIALRTARLVAGGAAAEAEQSLMVTEKMAAAAEAQMVLALGLMRGEDHAAVARRVVSGYRRKTAANRRRLTR